MKEEKGEGIILRVIPLNDSKRILTAFLPHEGIISLSARAISPSLGRLTAATSPLSRSELIYRRGRGEVHKLIEATLLSDHLILRSCAERLECAGEILQLLLRTQLPGKPSPLLYELTKAYLDRLQTTTSPKNLVTSFFLKFLKHEGLFLWTELVPPDFNKEEWKLAERLVNSRSFQEIETIDNTKNLINKIKIYIHHRAHIL
jgi:DNA repair protein RecO (recombination protein O)